MNSFVKTRSAGNFRNHGKETTCAESIADYGCFVVFFFSPCSTIK